MIAYLKIRLPFLEFSGGDGGLEWILLPIMLLVYLYSLVWVYYDAKRRKRGPWAPVAFIALGGWPLSIFWWTLLRPDYVDMEKFADLGEPDGGRAGVEHPVHLP
ncbi:MAG TPA: hypothetical protein VNZ22_06140 [Bacillota bacterium]|nr:hypothetical protein [Bacillota bacterium]